jgi:hypothetical protein
MNPKLTFKLLTAIICILAESHVSAQQALPDPGTLLADADKVRDYKAELITPTKDIKTIVYSKTINGLHCMRVELYSRVVGATDKPISVQIQKAGSTWALYPGKALKLDLIDKVRASITGAAAKAPDPLGQLDKSSLAIVPVEDATGKYYQVTGKILENAQTKALVSQAAQVASGSNSPITLPDIATEEALIGQQDHFVYKLTSRDSTGTVLSVTELKGVDLNTANIPDSLFEIPKDSKVFVIENSADYINALQGK